MQNVLSQLLREKQSKPRLVNTEGMKRPSLRYLSSKKAIFFLAENQLHL